MTRGLLRNIASGTVVSVMTVAYSLSSAALLFSGDLSSGLGYGFAVALTTAAILPFIGALTGSSPLSIAGPENNSTVVVATLAAAVAAQMAAAGPTDPAVVVWTALLWLTVATLATGGFLYIVGRLRLGQAVRFIPYTVLGGFLAATGWYMCKGAVSVITGVIPTWSTLDQFLTPLVAAKLAAGLVFAGILHLAARRLRHGMILPAALVAGVVAVHLALFLAGIGTAEAQALGWLFPPQPITAFWTPFDPAILARIDFDPSVELAGGMVAVMVVSALTILINASGLERAFDSEIDFNNELRTQGVANLVSAAAGGYVGHISLSRSILNQQAGATGRASGIVVAIIVGVILLAGSKLLGYVPPLVVGALLLYVGIGVVDEWAVRSFKRLEIIDYATVLLLLYTIAQWGFVAGLILGLVAGCMIFAVSYGRVRVYKHSISGMEYRSNVERSPAAIAVLDKHGRAIHNVILQGYIFFGSSHHLYSQLKELLEGESKYVILDFRLVHGIDASTTASFHRLAKIAAHSDAVVVLTNLDPAIRNALEKVGMTADAACGTSVVTIADPNDALEYCENAVLSAHCDGSLGECDFEHWLSVQMGGPLAAERIRAYLTPLDLAPGDYLFHQGEQADSIAIVECGRLGVYYERRDQEPVCLCCSEHHTILGEMGLFLDGPRTASVKAERPTICQILAKDDFLRMQRDHPEVAIAFHALIIRILAQRLSLASRSIAALQR